MMLIGTLFEVVGIGLVVPILVIMTHPNFIERYPMLQPWWEMLDDTLRPNITYCIPNPDISEEAVWSAVRAAQLEELVRQLPQGLDTLVGEQDVRLSGGQRQRIGIARARYLDPAVLVLDEATSALDSETESEVMKSIVALRGEKTVLIIAHRLSTIEHCDWIFRLEGGKVEAQGSAREQLAAEQTNVAQ